MEVIRYRIALLDENGQVVSQTGLYKDYELKKVAEDFKKGQQPPIISNTEANPHGDIIEVIEQNSVS